MQHPEEIVGPEEVVRRVSEKLRIMDHYQTRIKRGDPHGIATSKLKEHSDEFNSMLSRDLDKIFEFSATIDQNEFPCSNQTELFKFLLIFRFGQYPGCLVLDVNKEQLIDKAWEVLIGSTHRIIVKGEKVAEDAQMDLLPPPRIPPRSPPQSPPQSPGTTYRMKLIHENKVIQGDHHSKWSPR